MESEKVLLDAKTRDVSSPCSISSSSSTLEFDIDEKIPLDTSPTKPESNEERPLSRPEPISSPDITNLGPKTGVQSPSQESTPVASPMKSPPVQTMGIPAGYDPNRIPASIFSTKPTNPAEWSTTSNESLFSIHMGNNSFSRDYAILYGKSGELPKLEDQSNILHHISESKSNEMTSSLPPVMEHEESGVNSGELSRTETKDENKSPKVVQGPSVENHGKERMGVETSLPLSSNPLTYPSPPRLSDESGNSGSSFQFPVLVCDGGNGSSLKVIPEKPEKPPQPEARVYKETSRASERRWFSRCCCCWHRCC
ncbi:hypothetical protein BUALT_Bualt16G0022300 [Buddleja alternifolia]|uniref:Uncharacterized protein n=1 Tax=Buddleja alternifolia TaxID=168488 RepID=A0AAV6WEY8_9LAMI|nr:hypothetical protein BUALT_Bualt16G0022300 [Buddleja alternifolia]